jgi:hypothetical protein
VKIDGDCQAAHQLAVPAHDADSKHMGRLCGSDWMGTVKQHINRQFLHMTLIVRTELRRLRTVSTELRRLMWVVYGLSFDTNHKKFVSFQSDLFRER